MIIYPQLQRLLSVKHFAQSTVYITTLSSVWISSYSSFVWRVSGDSEDVPALSGHRRIVQQFRISHVRRAHRPHKGHTRPVVSKTVLADFIMKRSWCGNSPRRAAGYSPFDQYRLPRCEGRRGVRRQNCSPEQRLQLLYLPDSFVHKYFRCRLS